MTRAQYLTFGIGTVDKAPYIAVVASDGPTSVLVGVPPNDARLYAQTLIALADRVDALHALKDNP